MTAKTPPPRPNTPMVDVATGLVNKEWMRFFLLFFTNSEQTEGVVIDNTAQINSIQASLTSLVQLIVDINLEINRVSMLSTVDAPIISVINAPVEVSAIINNQYWHDNGLTVNPIHQVSVNPQEGHVTINYYQSEDYQVPPVVVTDCDWPTYFKSLSDVYGVTPYLYGAATPGTNTYSAQYGTWWRENGFVKLRLTLELSAFDNTTSGALLIGGLPVMSASNSIGIVSSYAGLSLPASSFMVFVSVTTGDSFLTIKYSGSGAGYVDSTPTDVVNPLSITCEITYRS